MSQEFNSTIRDAQAALVVDFAKYFKESGEDRASAVLYSLAGALTWSGDEPLNELARICSQYTIYMLDEIDRIDAERKEKEKGSEDNGVSKGFEWLHK